MVDKWSFQSKFNLVKANRPFETGCPFALFETNFLLFEAISAYFGLGIVGIVAAPSVFFEKRDLLEFALFETCFESALAIHYSPFALSEIDFAGFESVFVGIRSHFSVFVTALVEFAVAESDLCGIGLSETDLSAFVFAVG
jgi:hypothetical protein